MWFAKRRKLTKLSEIRAFLEKEDAFHDMILGAVEYDSVQKTGRIFIEEDRPESVDPTLEPLYQHYFEFKNITNFVFDADLALRAYVSECSLTGENELDFDLVSGGIRLEAEEIILDISDFS